MLSWFLIFIFSLWLWRICSLIVISATKQTLLKTGWHNICGWRNILVTTSHNTVLIIAVRILKKYLKDKKKCEERNMKCNMENVPKGHIIHRNKINTWNVNFKYHTTTDQTKNHMRIHTMKNSYHCFLCAKKSISRSCIKNHARENLNPYALCEREVVSRYHSKRRSKKIIE